ncbi:hypothetical protein Oter_1246 [Opitutus terrae PB90-1]|uniref:Uncharacterized protein n=1 Tax=Opitutus terrae (strain DSM 11246 / JCM 15787 / PB90-1) TaxID=452637 RepID=B1ZPL2_OPITP|nr:hypothetical protein Oter_1246 [Opitutus terrae PB90-1]
MLHTTTTLPPASAAFESTKPEWLRLPAPGTRCRFTGLSRGTLNELTIPCPANDHKPPVRSVVIRKRGAVRGIRLVSYDSLMGYLDALAHPEAKSSLAS